MLWILLSLGLVPQPEEGTKEQVGKLIARLQDDMEKDAWQAALQLSDLGPAAKEALPALRKRLQAKAAIDRAYAATALVLIDQAESAKAFPVLVAVFKDPSEVLTQFGLIARLGEQLRPTTKEVVEGLLQLAVVNRGSGWVIADQALSRIDAKSKQSRPAFDGLEAGLKHPSPVARILSARFLAKHDPARIPVAAAVLREELTTEDLSLRLSAAQTLLEVDAKQQRAVLDALAPGLKEKRTADRIRIALFLLEQDGERAEATVPVLRDALKETDRSAAKDVLHGLGSLLSRQGMRFPAVLPLFNDVLRFEEVGLRIEAMQQLGSLGPLAQPAERLLRRAAGEDKPEIAATAIEALMRLRPENAAERLSTFLEQVEKRDRTANGIGEFLKRFDTLRKQQETKTKEPWVEGLVTLIEQSDREGRVGWSREELLRLHAIVELGSLGSKAGKAVPALAKLLPDRDVKPLLRAQAAVALGRIGKPSRGAIPALNRVSREEAESPDIRAAARAALRLIDRDRDSQ